MSKARTFPRILRKWIKLTARIFSCDEEVAARLWNVTLDTPTTLSDIAHIARTYGVMALIGYRSHDFDKLALWLRVYREDGTDQRILHLRALLLRLANAVEAYRADQAGATDPRLGLVQPITVAEGEELDAALTVAWKELEEAPF